MYTFFRRFWVVSLCSKINTDHLKKLTHRSLQKLTHASHFSHHIFSPRQRTYLQGDFIFYSVLVSKAALYSFPAFASCMLVILVGLGGTLVLLSIYSKALPGTLCFYLFTVRRCFFHYVVLQLRFALVVATKANISGEFIFYSNGSMLTVVCSFFCLKALPISIFLGVVFYLLTRFCIQPWIQEVLRVPFYV